MQVAIEKHALRVEFGPDTLEVLPARIVCAEFRGGSRVHLAPVRASLIAFEDLFDAVEIRLVGHAPVHMHGDIDRVALIGRTEPDIVGAHKTALYREVDSELVLLDACLYFGDDRLCMLCRNIVFHLLEAHQARRGKEAMTIVDLVDVGDGLRRDGTDRFAETGKEAARL